MNTESNFTIALAGNPNVGKSTIFNELTKLHQHTGNWAGKTVACASGEFSYQNIHCQVMDLPGIYSLRTHSEEEEIAREYICSGEADLLLVVCDATCLERGLHFLKQVAALDSNLLPSMILCVNLCDEAAKKGILIDFEKLSEHLHIPVIPCTARSKNGLEQLKEQIYDIYIETEQLRPSIKGCRTDSPCPCCEHGCPFALAALHTLDTENRENPENTPRYLPPSDFSPKQLACQTVSYTNPGYRKREEKIDRLVTGKVTGTLIMILMLTGIFWITITGANYPSSFLWDQFYKLETLLAAWMTGAGAPVWLTNALVYGIYRVVAWVISVMLPPMAIFFPLFTILEDFGYLPRVAFNMDCAFKRCKACGKQCLTMCIGIASPRLFTLIAYFPLSKQILFKMSKAAHSTIIAQLNCTLVIFGC